MVNEENKLTIDLYHGTSTLFLGSIIKFGLGAINPVQEWNLLELSREVYDLSEKHLRESHLFQISGLAFKAMTEQSNGGSMNFQHGDTYLSPSKKTASNYAVNKQFGSEMLTYTIDFIKELERVDNEKVSKHAVQNMSKKYPKVFRLIQTNPAPLLIQVKNVSVTTLRDEHGGAPTDNLNEMGECFNENQALFEMITQQTNFRLGETIELDSLRFWLIDFRKLNQLNVTYEYYEINPKVTK